MLKCGPFIQNSRKKRFYTRTSKGYTAKEYKIIVYEDNNVIKGFSKFFIFVGRNDMERNKKCVIERLAADEEYESCKIRTQLLEWIKKYAEKCNCNSIDLRVCYENYDASTYIPHSDLYRQLMNWSSN